MQRRTITPLRSTVGETIPLGGVHLVGRSPDAAALNVTIEPFSDLQTRLANPLYDALMSQWRQPASGPAAPMIKGTATYPIPRDLAIPTTGSFVMIAANGLSASDEISRKLWIDIDIELPRNTPLVGGLCFGGFPFLPYFLSDAGEVSANYGLPREVRVSWKPGGARAIDGDDAGFLDDETSVTRQLESWHSGPQLLPLGPVSTDRLRLRLADFPRIVRHTGAGQSELWALLVPFLCIYRYVERVTTGPRTGVGLVAARQTGIRFGATYLPEHAADPDAPEARARRGVAADLVDRFAGTEQYAAFSAASLFGQRRTYLLDRLTHLATHEEVFVSNPLQKGQQVVLILAQASEYERSLAGLRLRRPRELPPIRVLETLKPGRFAVEVMEIDPPDGVPIARPDDDPSSDRYTFRLGGPQEIDLDVETHLVMRFVRPTDRAYLAVVFTCRSNEGVLVLQDLELVRSAHVTLAPRPSRVRAVAAVNFRLIGRDLADDYDALGRSGFGFSIERLEAGERKQILFEARTLLDLLHTGVGRLHRNARYWELTREVSEDQRRSDGWRRSETGRGVGYSAPIAMHPSTAGEIPTDGDISDNQRFNAYGTSEIRTHSTHIGFQGSNPDLNDQVVAINAAIGMVTGGTSTDYVSTAPFGVNLLTAGLDTDFWRGIDIPTIAGIGGLYHLNIPSHSVPAGLANTLIQLIQSPTQIDSAAVAALLADLPLQPLLGGVSGGANVSAGIGPVSVGFSLGSGQLMPTASRITSSGETGSIQRTANRSTYQYSQYRHRAFDQGATARRIVERQHERKAGAEVRWGGEYVDIVIGRIPVGLTLPATGGRVYRTTDQALRVRFINGLDPSVQCDVWFEITEEVVKDDY